MPRGLNRVYNRTGALFETPFRRKKVETIGYLRWLVWYIHANLQRHGLVSDFRSWPGSSYLIYANDLPSSFVNKKATIDWFDNLDGFLQFHNTNKKDLDDQIIKI